MRAQHWMADRVHAAAHAMQSADADAPRDRGVAQAEGSELPALDDAELGRRELREPVVDWR
jgi:hypothetical protein